VEEAGNVLDILYSNILSIFSFLAIQEVLRLLYVSIMSFKEAKRTFLTPVGVKNIGTGQK
jgi:hypothetical protein